MKRIISLLMVVSVMILSVGTAFAAYSETVTTGLNIAAVEDENGLITVTVTANDTRELGGVTVWLALDGVKAVKSSDKTTEVTTFDESVVLASGLPSTWAPSGAKYDGTLCKIVVGGVPGKTFSNEEIFKAYFVKTDASSTLSKTAFAYGADTKTAQTSKISFTDTTITALQSKNVADQAYFGLKVTPYVAPVTGWTETGKTVDGEDVTVTVKFPTTADEKAGSDWTGTTSDKGSVVKSMFGKAATDLKGAKYENGVFTKGDYSVDYNGQTYYGIVDVTAGNYWAILIIESVSAN